MIEVLINKFFYGDYENHFEKLTFNSVDEFLDFLVSDKWRKMRFNVYKNKVRYEATELHILKKKTPRSKDYAYFEMTPYVSANDRYRSHLFTVHQIVYDGTILLDKVWNEEKTTLIDVLSDSFPQLIMIPLLEKVKKLKDFEVEYCTNKFDYLANISTYNRMDYFSKFEKYLDNHSDSDCLKTAKEMIWEMNKTINLLKDRIEGKDLGSKV